VSKLPKLQYRNAVNVGVVPPLPLLSTFLMLINLCYAAAL